MQPPLFGGKHAVWYHRGFVEVCGVRRFVWLNSNAGSMVNCSAYGCNSHSSKKEPGITFHRFPKDGRKQKLWVQNMHIADWKPSQNDRICSKHFEAHCFYKTAKKVLLLDDTVPTIFTEPRKYMQPKPMKTRKRAHSASPEASPEPGPLTSMVQEEPDTPRKKKLKRQLFREVVKSKAKTRKIRVLGQSLKRYKKKVVSLKHLLKDLQSKNLLSSENSKI